MKTLMTIEHGSTLYGTKTPSSDVDYKSVFIPNTKDILLQKHVAKSSINLSTKKDTSRKNDERDIDNEAFSLLKFMEMLKVGDMIATEILFVPEQNFINISDEWRYVISYREHYLNKQIKGFIGYCQKQAAKYGIKGSRVAAIRAALELVDIECQAGFKDAKLGNYYELIEHFCKEHEFSQIVEIEQPLGKMLFHWEVCDRKMPYTISLKECRNILQKVFDNYGERARMAESNDGVDWKAVSHAIRAGYQSLELVRTGIITFPRPDAQELLDIKLGKIPYKEIAEKLEQLVLEVESEAKKSFLRDEPDIEFMDKLVYEMYGAKVSESFRGR